MANLPPPPPGKQRGNSSPIRGRLALGLFGLCALCLLFSVIYSATPAGQQATAERNATRTAEAQAAAGSISTIEEMGETATEEGMAIEKSTVVPAEAPTELPPTATSEPSPTPEPTSPPPPPEPLVFTGSGQSVTDNFVPPAGVLIIEGTHDGGSNFIVNLNDAQSGSPAALFWQINVIGSYRGASVAQFMNQPQEAYFEVMADGAWTLTVKTAANLEVTEQLSFSGSGPTVTPLFRLKSGRVDVDLSHGGVANFIVTLHNSESGSASLTNEIGAYTGTTSDRAGEGLHFLDVQADGDWTATIRQP